jgi:hypothetical protein
MGVIWIDSEIGTDGLLQDEQELDFKSGGGEKDADGGVGTTSTTADPRHKNSARALALKNTTLSLELGAITSQLYGGDHHDLDRGSGIVILPLASLQEFEAFSQRTKETLKTAASRGGVRMVITASALASPPPRAPKSAIASATAPAPTFRSSSLAYMDKLDLPAPIAKRKVLVWVEMAMTAEQQLLFTKAKAAGIEVIHLLNTAGLLRWLENTYKSYSDDVKIITNQSRPRDPGVPEQGIAGGEEAGSSLITYLKIGPNAPKWKEVSMLLYSPNAR